MTTTFIQASDAPILETINGVERKFVLWPTRELIPIIAKRQAKYLEALRVNLKTLDVTPREMAYALAKAESSPMDVDDAYVHLISPEGVDTCLVKSLMWGGLDEATATVAVERIRFKDKQRLAARVCNIYELKPLAAATPPADATPPGQVKYPPQPVGFGEQQPPAASAPVPSPTPQPLPSMPEALEKVPNA